MTKGLKVLGYFYGLTMSVTIQFTFEVKVTLGLENTCIDIWVDKKGLIGPNDNKSKDLYIF